MLPRYDAAAPPVAADSGQSAPAGDARQQAFQRALADLVGQSLDGEVLSKLNDGSYLVKITDTSVRMMLPPGVEVGAEVPMTVLSAYPRPTFQIGSGTPSDNQAPQIYTATPETPAMAEAYAPPLPSQAPPASLPQPSALPPGVVQEAVQAAADAAAALPDAAPAATAPQNPAANSAAAQGAASQAASNQAAPGYAAGAVALAAAASAAAAARAAAAGVIATAATPAAARPPAAADSAATAAEYAGADGADLASALAAGQEAGAAPAAAKPLSPAATLLGKAPLTPASQLPELDPATPGPTLSSMARVLTSVLSSVTPNAYGSQPVLIGKAALVGANTAPVPEQLAQKLHDTVAQSGLFYESHVSDWVKGERSLPDLLREPQMQRQADAAADPQTAARPPGSAPDLSAAQLVNLQLHTQEQARVQWQGEAWPGQQMQWDIQREQREGGKSSDEPGDGSAPVWRSGVRFRFPILGNISASVTVAGDQVQIQVQADSGESAATLRAYAGQLEAAMTAAGAPLSSLTISQRDGADEGADGR